MCSCSTEVSAGVARSEGPDKAPNTAVMQRAAKIRRARFRLGFMVFSPSCTQKSAARSLKQQPQLAKAGRLPLAQPNTAIWRSASAEFRWDAFMIGRECGESQTLPPALYTILTR